MAKKEGAPRELEVGKTYFFQGMKDWTGRVVQITGPNTVIIEHGAWVAYSGRLHDFLRDGRADNMEIEPVPDGMVTGLRWENWHYWPHALLREQV